MKPSAHTDRDATSGGGGSPLAAGTPAALLREGARKRVLRNALCVGLAMGLPLAALWWYLVSATLALAFFSTALAWAAILGLLRFTGRVALCGRLACTALYALCVACAFLLGGIHSYAMAWMITVPIAAAAVSGERETWFWCGVTGASGFLFYSIDHSANPLAMPTALLSGQAALVMYLATVAVFGALSTVWLRAQRMLEDALRQSLAETAAETKHVGVLFGLSHAVSHSETFALAAERVLAKLDAAFVLEGAAVWATITEPEASPVAVFPAGATLPNPDALRSRPAVEVADDGSVSVVQPIHSAQETHGLLYARVRSDPDGRLPSLLENVASQLAMIWLKDQRSEALSRQAYVDDLTELPNRRSFHQVMKSAVERARVNGHQAALIYIDLDGFKRINDTLGHEAGDQVLRRIARRIQGAIRLSDHACTHRDASPRLSRLGGDEFTVLLQEVGAAANAELVANRILASISRPVNLGGREVEIGASVGLAVYPDDGRTPGELVRAADKSMYAAKHAGGNRFRRFDAGADPTDLVEFGEMLTKAMENRELELHYQPIVDGEQSRPVAVEALLRWNHPTRGMLSPGWFVPLAEEAGRIRELGAFVIREAVRWFEKAHRALPDDFRVCVNVSPHQFEDAAFVELVKELLEDASFQPAQLELEVTESVLVADAPEVLAHIRALADLGVCFSLDDFGTGYSSLSLVKRLPVSRIKIDRSFVAGLPDDSEDVAIVYAVLGIAHSLGVPVVAEGVEDEAQQTFLTIRGCQELQGFLFARPCAPDALLLAPEEE